MGFRLDDYIDADVAYLAGLIIGRGTIEDGPSLRQLTIEFPFTSLQAEGIKSKFDQEVEIQFGLTQIRERLLELLATDISIIRKDNSIDFVIRFLRNSMIWRNILLLTGGRTSFPYFRVPPIFFDPNLEVGWKREFIKGYADVAGNVRRANYYVDGRNRVRLDVLNYPTNWEVPVQICTLLQEHLEIPVQIIAYGHPNLGREWREHQINIFAKAFLPIGFTFRHKQTILEEFAESDDESHPHAKYGFCPGIRRPGKKKHPDPEENNEDRLDARLVGQHFDAYWQICKALGCRRMPPTGPLLSSLAEDEVDPGDVEES